MLENFWIQPEDSVMSLGFSVDAHHDLIRILLKHRKIVDSDLIKMLSAALTVLEFIMSSFKQRINLLFNDG